MTKRRRRPRKTGPISTVFDILCTRCRASGPLFMMTGGSEGALCNGITRRGNHFHLIGLWMAITDESTQELAAAKT